MRLARDDLLHRLVANGRRVLLHLDCDVAVQDDVNPVVAGSFCYPMISVVVEHLADISLKLQTCNAHQHGLDNRERGRGRSSTRQFNRHIQIRRAQERHGRRHDGVRLPASHRRVGVLVHIEIDTTAAEWEPHGKGTVEGLRQVAAQDRRPQDCELLDAMAAGLKRGR